MNRNPFADAGDNTDNPFDDPDIGQALASGATNGSSGGGGGVSAYAGYQMPSSSGAAEIGYAGYTSIGINDSSESTKIKTSAAAPTNANAYAGGGGGGSGGDVGIAAREAELRRREEELSAREAELEQQQNALRAHGLHPPNWPSLYPLVYHDIDAEVPAASRPVAHK
ncbi:hypothetical protein HK100_009046, partial [Physocladia obscura]